MIVVAAIYGVTIALILAGLIFGWKAVYIAQMVGAVCGWTLGIALIFAWTWWRYR